jgi:amino acid permease
VKLPEIVENMLTTAIGIHANVPKVIELMRKTKHASEVRVIINLYSMLQ